MYDKLTENDVRRMEEEIEHRKLVVRREAIDKVKEARAQGDLSENFEYYAAKREKNKNESRIRYLERMVRTAKIVEDNTEEGVVGLDNTVTIYIPDDDETETYKLVTTVRADSLNNLITIESPLGKALMGHRVGDTVTVKINDTAGYDVVIKDIEATTDKGEEEIRQY
ncbi:MAG: transcription elongation factor GreA [Catonella sp.]|jgi:transcription elongation factor GreA|nr:transcription elongation factor GreA [Catonella sp.]MDY6355852.1 transcription elongation factor GreA [Catonella sp.]